MGPVKVVPRPRATATTQRYDGCESGVWAVDAVPAFFRGGVLGESVAGYLADEAIEGAAAVAGVDDDGAAWALLGTQWGPRLALKHCGHCKSDTYLAPQRSAKPTLLLLLNDSDQPPDQKNEAADCLGREHRRPPRRQLGHAQPDPVAQFRSQNPGSHKARRYERPPALGGAQLYRGNESATLLITSLRTDGDPHHPARSLVHEITRSSSLPQQA